MLLAAGAVGLCFVALEAILSDVVAGAALSLSPRGTRVALYYLDLAGLAIDAAGARLPMGAARVIDPIGWVCSRSLR